MIVLINLFCCILVLIAYFLISLRIFGYQTCFLLSCKSNKNIPKNLTNLKKNENRKAFRQIFITVLTNLLTWFPICSFALYTGFNSEAIFNHIVKHEIRKWFMLITTPIDCILNPYIYTSFTSYY